MHRHGWLSWFLCLNWYTFACSVSEKFREKCIEIHGLDPSYFYPATGLGWQACFKETEVKLELLTGIDMLLMIEKGIKGEMCQSTRRYAKANTWRIMIKILGHYIWHI